MYRIFRTLKFFKPFYQNMEFMYLLPWFQPEAKKLLKILFKIFPNLIDYLELNKQKKGRVS